jgi:hypothetical protein
MWAIRWGGARLTYLRDGDVLDMPVRQRWTAVVDRSYGESDAPDTCAAHPAVVTSSEAASDVVFGARV